MSTKWGDAPVRNMLPTPNEYEQARRLQIRRQTADDVVAWPGVRSDESFVTDGYSSAVVRRAHRAAELDRLSGLIEAGAVSDLNVMRA
jgi:hypothetical protein